MTDSTLVITCHCPEKHNQLYHVTKTRKQGRAVGPKATYVDPYSCPERTWGSIKARSKSIVWGENCPVYMQLTRGLYYTKKDKQYELKDDPVNEVATSRKLFSILDESYRILRKGGKVIFGDDMLPAPAIIQQINNHPMIVEKFSLEVVPSEGAKIHLAQTECGRFTARNYLYIFTKKGQAVSRRLKSKAPL